MPRSGCAAVLDAAAGLAVRAAVNWSHWIAGRVDNRLVAPTADRGTQRVSDRFERGSCFRAVALLSVAAEDVVKSVTVGQAGRCWPMMVLYRAEARARGH